jgi:hypothetical protein
VVRPRLCHPGRVHVAQCGRLIQDAPASKALVKQSVGCSPLQHSYAMGSEHMSLDAVAALAAASEVLVRDRLISLMRGRTERLETHTPFAASSAIAAYRVRLKLWQDDLLPAMTGFPEFVAGWPQTGA